MESSENKLRQPVALPICFLTELWERYGFYLLQGLLLLYMTSYLRLDEGVSYELTGTFIGLVYTASVIGGMVADRFVGNFRGIIIGELLLCFGFFILGISIGSGEALLFWALACIAIGTGLIKANISTYLGYFYIRKDPRRDLGFTIFYIGINVGAIIGVFFAGFGQHHFGWSVPFYTAAGGSLIGLLTIVGGVYLKKLDFEKKHRDVKVIHYLASFLVVLASVVACYFIFYYSYLSDILFITICVASVMILISHMIKYSEIRAQIFAYLLLLLISVVFWSMYFQLYISMTLLVANIVNHHIFGIFFPTPTFLIFANLGVVLFGGFMGKLWFQRAKAGHPVHDGTKFLTGLILMCCAFVILALGVTLSNATVLMSGYIIVAVCLVVSLGDLSLSPIGLSIAHKLSPEGCKGLYMGMWLISLGVGGKLAGTLSGLMVLPSHKVSLAEMYSVYGHGLWVCIAIMLFAIALAVVINPLLKRLIPY